MDCCGHALTRRNWLWGTVLASLGTALGGAGERRAALAQTLAGDRTAAARQVLSRFISVDVHTHGGTTGITSKAPPSGDLANGMRAGALAAACLADVPDAPLLGRNSAGVLGATRAAQPGELYRHHL